MVHLLPRHLHPVLGDYVDAALTFGVAQTADSIRLPLTSHSREIFTKGYRYVTVESGESMQFAVTKSLNGLQRFLDLPLEFYSTRLVAAANEPASARALRAVCSSMVSAILTGYATLELGELTGAQALPRFSRSWSHAISFMNGADLERVLESLEPGDFRKGVALSVTPFVEAIDELASSATDYVPLPALAQLNWGSRRLDTSLRPPPHSVDTQFIEVQCFLDASFVNRDGLEEAASRDTMLAVAPLRPDLQAIVNSDERRHSRVVPAALDPSGIAATRARVQATLEYGLLNRRATSNTTQPLRHNPAKGFPLNNPFLTRYFHVYRSSVRDLLRAFERRNGVRLWCSVRRSGKTTAGLDLGATTGRSTVVAQTCDHTGQIPGGSVFYDAITSALSADTQVSNDFLQRVVARCSPGGAAQGDRVVFVLDEYETLFGHMQAAMARSPSTRYTVVQPLLNQMVAFTRDNLLVFLGQQPNAHYLLMEQTS